METKQLKIEADLMWAFLDTPNTMSGKYQVDLCNLSKNAIKALEEVGVNVRNKDEKGFFVTAKSKNYPISAIDEKGNPIFAKIGNGSRGVALIKPYAYKMNGKSGVGVGINKLVVTKLVEYNPEPVDTADVL
jgi:hypothetical protein